MKRHNCFNKIAFILCIFMLIALTPASVFAEGGTEPSITLSTYDVKSPGETFEVTISGASNPTGGTDWIGLYEADSQEEDFQPSGDTPSIWWAYAGDVGISGGEGSFTFDPNSADVNQHMEQPDRYLPGKKFKFILMKDNGYDIEAVSTSFTLTKPLITLSTYDVKSPGETFEVTISGARNPTGGTDWIGLYEADSQPGGDNPSIWWAYAGDVGISEGKGSFTFDPNGADVNQHMEQSDRYLPGKKFKFILMKDDGYDIEAVSASFALNDIKPSISLSSNKINGNLTKFSVTVKNAQEQPGDRVAIYEEEVVPGEKDAIWCSLITDTGVVGGNGSFEFDPAKVKYPDRYNIGKKYKFVLMDNASYTVKASTEFVVQNEGSPVMTLSASEVDSKCATIAVTITNSQILPEAGDWIGLYEADVIPDSSIEPVWWAYLNELGITGGNGQFTFDPEKLSHADRYIEGKAYKFNLMYDNAYKVEAFAQFEIKPKISVKAEVDNSTGLVNVYGKISSGAGKQITGKIVDQKGDIVYIDQVNSREDGSFDFKASIAGNGDGKYTVMLRGKDMKKAISQEFVYYSKKEPPVISENTETNTAVPVKDLGITVTKDGFAKGGIKPVVKDGRVVIDISKAYLEELFKKTGENKEGKKVIIEVLEDKNLKLYTVELPVGVLTSDKNNKIEVRTSGLSIQISDRMLKGMGKADTDKAVIQVSEVDKDKLGDGLLQKIGNRPVINLAVTVGGKEIMWNNGKSALCLSMKYAPQASEAKDPEYIVVWRIDENNKLKVVPSGKYNGEIVQFSADSSGIFTLGYEKKTFSDLNKCEWAKKYIEVMASKDIVQGEADGTFAPNENIKRADFLKFLISALDLSVEYDTNFSDVKPDEDYYEAVGIARKLGIVTGTGNGRFEPDTTISRQDMMVMTDKALKAAGVKLATSGTGVGRYSDKKEIASYAKESMDRLGKAGIICGNNDLINPKGFTTKAQAAKIVYVLYYMTAI